MAIVMLTDAYVRTLAAPASGRLEITDEVRAGLRLRVSTTGRKTWMYEKRVKGGPKRKHDLGPYPHTSIKEARAKALVIQIEADAGIDRIQIEKDNKKQAAANARDSVTLRTVIESYDVLHLSNIKTGRERKGDLLSALAPYLDQPAKDLTDAHLQDVIDDKARSGAKVRANRYKASFLHFSKFAHVRKLFSPGVGLSLQKAIKEQPRERDLSLVEMRIIWAATYRMGKLWGPFLRLLILTAQRRREIGSLKWEEIDFQKTRIVLGGVRTKTSNAHITHLSAPAMEEIKLLHAASSERKSFIFTTTGRTPVSGYSKMKLKLNEVIGDAISEPWTLHDLRTGFTTVMNSVGEPEGVVDRILNHQASGSAPSPVARIYNKAKLLPERKIVLDRWARLVTGEEEPLFRDERDE